MIGDLKIKFSRLQEDVSNSDEERPASVHRTRSSDTSIVRRRGCLSGERVRSCCMIAALFCMFLVICFNKREISFNDKHLADMVAQSDSAYDTFKTELQSVGGKVNSVWSNISRLSSRQNEFLVSKPWQIDINDSKQNLQDSFHDLMSRLSNTEEELKSVKQSNKDAKEHIRNLEEQVDKKLGVLNSSSSDIATAHSDLKDNVYQARISNKVVKCFDHCHRLVKHIQDLFLDDL